MQILKTGQRLTLPSPQVQLQFSGAAAAGMVAAFSVQGQVLTVDLAEHPLGDLLRVPQTGQLSLDLARLPAEVQMVAVFHRAGTSGEVVVSNGPEQYRYEGPAEAGQAGAQVRLVEFYRRDGGWKLYAAGETVGPLEKVDLRLPALITQAQARAQELRAQASRPAPVAPAAVTAPAAAPPSPTPPAAPLTLSKQATQAKLLSLAKDQAPAMVPVIEQARLTLQKAGLDTLTFEVVLVLDVSGSMSDLFSSGQVQRLVERALAVAARLDDNGEVPVTLFGTHARSGGTVLLSNITGYIRSMRFDYDGGTVYAPAIRQVVKNASDASWPTLVLFVTDGENSDPREAEAAMTQASSEAVFFKFLALGSGPFRFLERLDTMSGRVVDNANFAQIENLTRLGDAELFRLISQEISDWIPAATRAGILDAQGRPNRGARPGPPRPTPPSRERARQTTGRGGRSCSTDPYHCLKEPHQEPQQRRQPLARRVSCSTTTSARPVIRFCSNSREYGNATVFPSISAKPYFLMLAAGWRLRVPLARTPGVLSNFV